MLTPMTSSDGAPSLPSRIARTGPLVLLMAAGAAALGACEDERCTDAKACPPEAPYCGPSGACTDIPPPDQNPIGGGEPIDALPDAGAPPDPYAADAGPLACAEDAQEDNDTRATAAAVTGGGASSACGCQR